MAKKASQNKSILTVLVIVAVVVVGGAVYLKSRQKSSPTATYNPQTKVSQPGSAGQSGGVVDNQGAETPGTGGTPATTTPTSSASGIITLTSPASGAALTNGTVITGTATGLTTVQYRVEDPARGQLAQGPLSVSNGRFSGTLAGLAPQSKSGTLEIYDYNAQGAEENDAKIAVSFP